MFIFRNRIEYQAALDGFLPVLFCCNLQHNATPRVTPFAVEFRRIVLVMTCFAARLKQLRNQRGLTQTEVAAAIGVTRSVVSLYENEMRQPSPEIIIALARLYGVTADYLLCGNRRSFVDVSGLNEQEIAAIVNMVGLLRSKK